MQRIVVSMAVGAMVALAVVAAAAEELPAIPPMPEIYQNIKIVKPGSSVPKAVADFLGKWEGVWKAEARRGKDPKEIRRCRLIIYEVSANQARALYGVGESPSRPLAVGWFKNDYDIKDEGGKKRLSCITGLGFDRTFYLEQGVLKGSQGTLSIEMHRVK